MGPAPRFRWYCWHNFKFKSHELHGTHLRHPCNQLQHCFHHLNESSLNVRNVTHCCWMSWGAHWTRDVEVTHTHHELGLATTDRSELELIHAKERQDWLDDRANLSSLYFDRQRFIVVCRGCTNMLMNFVTAKHQLEEQVLKNHLDAVWKI